MGPRPLRPCVLAQVCLVANLTQDQIHQLGALIHTRKQIDRWDDAAWVGCCANGHVVVAAAPLRDWPCTEDWQTEEYTVTTCGKSYRDLPNQDALIAAFRLGGWMGMVEIAREMIGSVDGY